MDLPIGKPINQLVWWDGTVVCLVVQSESRPPFFHTIYSARWIKMVRACTLSTVHNSIRVHRWLEYDGYRRMLGLWNRDELRFNLLDFWRIRYRFSLWCPMVNHAYSFLASVEQDEPTWKSNNVYKSLTVLQPNLTSSSSAWHGPPTNMNDHECILHVLLRNRRNRVKNESELLNTNQKLNVSESWAYYPHQSIYSPSFLQVFSFSDSSTRWATGC